MTKHVLEPMRHSCVACGACCQGAKVYVRPGDEAERIKRLAVELGYDRAAIDEDDWLIRNGGSCAFLQDDGLCHIHAVYGLHAKPSVCVQFPYVEIETESGRRVGCDPCSSNSIFAWRSGEPVDTPEAPVVRPAHLPEPLARAEAALVALTLKEGSTVATLAGVLCGLPQHAGPELPPGFASRVVRILQASALPLVLQAPDGGPFQVRMTEPLLEAAAGWDAANPPAWPAIDAEADAYSLWVLRNMLYLRMASSIPMPQGVALILLVGIVANGWRHHDNTSFGQGVAAWSRLMRAGAFWQALTPSPGVMQWLGTGQGREPG